MAIAKSAPTTLPDQLLQAVNQVDRPGAICTSRDLPMTMPGLEVDQVGAIRLPLGKTQARRLIKQCSQAPYGKGTKTLVDTDVRRVWELDPKQFQLTNPKWEELISSITSEVQIALGLDKKKLRAHLYKLLVYEKGGFFLPHQDGEKLAGMVATLVVGLPSPHAGGELIVSHEGRRHEIALAGAASGLELSYAAFYADCQHEVLPVRDGYRLCLAYNLTLAQARPKKIAAPRTAKVARSIGQLLQGWSTSGDIQKLAVALAHQYTQEGLRIDALKGVDRARAEVLFDAAEQAGCVAHLALMTRWQNGAAEGEYDYYSSRRGRRRWSYDDELEEEDEAGEDGKHVMGEIYDESLSLDRWSDRDGKQVGFGEIDLSEEEIVSDQPLKDWTLGREEYEGYTGNAGMTLERWYHRAAVVLWPKANHFAVLCDAGTDAAISGLEAMVKRWKRARKAEQPPQRQSCLELAAAIIASWAPLRFRYNSDPVPKRVDRSEFPRLLHELDDPEPMRQFVARVLPQDGEIQLDKSFPMFCQKHGWRTFQDCLSTVVDESSAATIGRNAKLLERLCLKRDQNVDRRELCRHLAERLVTALEQLDSQQPKHHWQTDEIDRAALLGSLVKSLLSIEAAETLAPLIEHTLALEKKYDLTDVHLATIFALESWLSRKLTRPNRTVSNWLAHCRTELEQRTAHAPAPPADFRRDAKLSCTCGDCRALSRFLADPDESVHRFPVAKERRQHLHQAIDGSHCDLTHVTTRIGRPYTLVCTKTTASYEAACKIYSRDQEHLKRLRAIENKIDQAVEG